MQSLAGYFVFLAIEDSRNAQNRHRYASASPKKSGRLRVAAALSALARPVRRAAAAA
jgi:hypothetical protein